MNMGKRHRKNSIRSKYIKVSKEIEKKISEKIVETNFYKRYKEGVLNV